NVIEFTGGTTTNGNTGLSQATADGDGFPYQDSYTVALTLAPAGGKTVTVRATAQPTRTSETGGIVGYQQQLRLCLPSALDCTIDGNYSDHVDIAFTSTNWNQPQTVMVRAVDNARVDGMDTHVFAPQLSQLNNVQGPLFINGGEGTDRTGLLEREPLMLPGERNELPSMGHVVSSTPGTDDNSVAATVTIDPSTIPRIKIDQVKVDHTVQDIEINAIGGTFTLTYDGQTTGSLPFNAPAVDVENQLKALTNIQNVLMNSDSAITVSTNANVYEVTFFDPSASVDAITATGSGLKPMRPADLVNFTIEITHGPAKNKTRIITGAVCAVAENPCLSGHNWVLTLDNAWKSKFTGNASTPDSTSSFTLLSTNPNLLVDESTTANLLYLYDTDNPASYNDANLTPNPFGQGQLFFDSTVPPLSSPPADGQFGPPDADGKYTALNQFRITGFGMGPNRCIGGPSIATVSGDEANACNGPVGANEPGGITFKGVQDLQINLGAGNNHFTFYDSPAGAFTTLNTRAGNDVVDVQKISGHTTVNTGAGSDTVNVCSHTDSTDTCTNSVLSQVKGLLTVSGDSPQATMVNLVNGSPAQGTAVSAVNAIQQLTVDATGGSYAISYAPRPLKLSGIPGAGAGSLAANTYFYEVTAQTTYGETLPSPETFVTVGDSGTAVLSWYAAPGATSYNVYRATSSGAELRIASSVSGTTYTDMGTATPSGAPPTVGVVETATGVAFDAPATGLNSVQSALEGLALIGAGNVSVTRAGNVYAITFNGAAAGTAIALLLTDPTGLTNGLGSSDTLNIDDTAATAADAALLTSTSLTGLD
ncbi:MAG TPA: hypothetical protein VGA62_01335, partial [Acidimicrobiia bacterium]